MRPRGTSDVENKSLGTQLRTTGALQMQTVHPRRRKAQLRFGSGNFPPTLTFVFPKPDIWGPQFQLQWDYRIDWPPAGRPVITLLRFRSYQKRSKDGQCELVEAISENIPLNDSILRQISEHAGGYLYADSDLDGAWRLSGRDYVDWLRGGIQEELRPCLIPTDDAGSQARARIVVMWSRHSSGCDRSKVTEEAKLVRSEKSSDEFKRF